jgi:hypothetical protein
LFSKKHKETFELWRIAAEGGQPERLGPLPKTMGGGFGEAVGEELRLHPDGRRVASTSAEDNTTEIWVMENFLPGAQNTK